MKTRIFLSFVLLLFGITQAMAQTTAFTYQGKLTDGGSAPNGNYDLTFQLFDTSTVGSGAQLGATLNLNSVPVSSGVFTVQLDFGACPSCFNGANRFLEIAVRPSGGGSFSTLSPRQPISSTPYAVRSVSAATADGLSLSCASCVTSAQIQNVQGSQVTGAVAGSQINGTIPVASVPAGSASYIQNGTAQQASSAFNISGNGVIGGRLGVNTSNPQYAVHVVGQDVRVESNTVNTFPRFSWNFTGGGSHEKKWQAYAAPLTLNFSALTDFENFEDIWMQVKRRNLTNIESITFPSYGSIVGVGTSSPQAKLHVSDIGTNAFRPTALRVESDYSGAILASFGAIGPFQIDAPGIPGGRLNVYGNGTVILGDCVGCFPGVSDRLIVNGTTRIVSLGSGGSTSLCRNGSGQISACSSSLRYKNKIANFSSGLSLLNRLRPVTFDWKDSRAHDLGLVAEEVAAAEPLLVTRNEKGEVEGVKYDRLSAVFINAFKEQQNQIEQQQAQIKAQDKALGALRTQLASLEQAVRHPRTQQGAKVSKLGGRRPRRARRQSISVITLNSRPAPN